MVSEEEDEAIIVEGVDHARYAVVFGNDLYEFIIVVDL